VELSAFKNTPQRVEIGFPYQKVFSVKLPRPFPAEVRRVRDL
jgi:hypothetical protein